MSTIKSTPAVAIVTTVTILFATGCEDLRSEGDLGRTSFRYSCIGSPSHSCTLHTALAVDAREVITVHGLDGGDLPALALESSDTSVLEVKGEVTTRCYKQVRCADSPAHNFFGKCSDPDELVSVEDRVATGERGERCAAGNRAWYNVQARARGVAPGEAKLELRTLDGRLYDKITVRVSRIHQIDIYPHGPYGSVEQQPLTASQRAEGISLDKGSHYPMLAFAYDSDGHQVAVFRSMTFTIADPGVAVLRYDEWDRSTVPPVSQVVSKATAPPMPQSDLKILGQKAGKTRITARVGKASGSMDLKVVAGAK